ncbi:anti-sigma factor [Pseudomonas sp. GD03842]|uniref:anti-sigma factor n=1 Tax=Pseudomonas sp. GD03842 TaxID=2975385 RepID=UPI00244D1572|nr:anti-sigma factor [Pseudomonas sp. GD03842]MDH0746978.1 anti-sigma factor [Pseudomonas sp. GD03842]
MNENDLPPTDDRDTLIAEYVLGVLASEERARVEALAARDSTVRAAISAWQSHFDGWLGQLPEVRPPASVWEAIDQRLFATRISEAEKRPGLWRNPGFWRWACAALAACLLVSLLPWVQPGHPAAPAMLARLEQNDGHLLFAATVQPGAQTVVFVPTGATTWQGRSAQAWIIAGDGKPRSLGLLPPNAPAALNIPAELVGAITKGAALAVSLEPPNGSPTGLPTGPVIAQGKISTL